VIELIGSRALGPRDRLMLVQVGNEQILLGLTPAPSRRCMCSRAGAGAQTESATPEFAQRLMELLGKDQKDKK
jgi:flagellar protein FliO/FliZ